MFQPSMFVLPPPAGRPRYVNMPGVSENISVSNSCLNQTVSPNHSLLDIVNVLSPILQAMHSSLKADIENINKCLPINKLYSQSVSAPPILPAREWSTLVPITRPPPRVAELSTSRSRVNDTLAAGASTQAEPERRQVGGEWRQVLKGPKQHRVQERESTACRRISACTS